METVENRRVALQGELDAQKTQSERNRLGQFATPTALARDILRYSVNLLPTDDAVRFLDPAVGTGSFYSALREVALNRQIKEAVGFEIDPHYADPAVRLWKDSGLAVHLADFTHAIPNGRFNLVICNPPYVRHHHLENGSKTRLRSSSLNASGMKLSGLAGLYCHFIGLSHAWMDEGAVATWLIPSEFMDVNYGRTVKHYLLSRVTLLGIHRFDPNDVQFADALVSSAVVSFRNVLPPQDHKIKFSFGGSLFQPKLARDISAHELAREPKWTRFPASDIRSKKTAPTISDFFRIKRGLATGDNGYFILSEEEIRARCLPPEAFVPILPSPRYLEEDEVKADKDGNPKIEHRLFLLHTSLTEEEIGTRFPALHAYLEGGKARGLHERYLCRHRSLWYAQENRPAPPIVCTYLGRSNTVRGRPFRFILNSSCATVANVYLAMYPTPILTEALNRDHGLIRRVWKALNSLEPSQLLGEGRVYGGGLHKLEPKELANVPVPEIAALLPTWEPLAKQTDLFTDLAS
jgi:adenine-specific DNA-methyltransferase